MNYTVDIIEKEHDRLMNVRDEKEELRDKAVEKLIAAKKAYIDAVTLVKEIDLELDEIGEKMADLYKARVELEKKKRGS